MPRPSCSAIILAGGRASRMAGRDKALLSLAGQPLLAHVLARLRPQVDDIVISYNRDPADLAGFDCAIVQDATQDHAGPLAGIATALPRCRDELVCVVPCDAPFLPEDLVAHLAAALQTGKSLAVAHDGQRLQPLFLLMQRRLLGSLQAALARGEHQVRAWCLNEDAAQVEFADAFAFSNVNTPEDLQAAEKRAEKN